MPSSRMETKSPSATMIWSASTTPTASSARFKTSVVCRSSGLGRARPLVVRQHDGGRVGVQRGLDHLARGDGRDVHAAAVDEHAVERLALGVEAQQIHDLLVLAVEIGEQVPAAFGRGVEHLDLRAAAHEAAARHLRHEPDQLRCGVSDTADLFEFRLRRGKHAVERPESA